MMQASMLTVYGHGEVNHQLLAQARPTSILERESSPYRIAYFRPLRKLSFMEDTNLIIQHYHTTVLVMDLAGRRIRYFDGFSATDAEYVSRALWHFNVPAGVRHTYARQGGFQANVLEMGGRLYTGRLSASLLYDAIQYAFYPERAIKTLKERTFDPDRIEVFIDLDRTIPFKEWSQPPRPYYQYIPPLRTLEYIGEKPDATLIIYDGIYDEDHIFDVFGDYAVYVKVLRSRLFGEQRVPCFLIPLEKLRDEVLIPPLIFRIERHDPWRVTTTSEAIRTRASVVWLKIISGYLVALGETEVGEVLWEEVKKLARDKRTQAVLVINYTSNILVTYADIYIKLFPGEIDELTKRRISYLKHAAEWETVDKTFRALFPGFHE